MAPTSEPTCDNGSTVKSDEARMQKRLAEVAAKMRVIFAMLSEIETNYPDYWEFVQRIVRDDLDPAKKIPPGMDLETWAKQQGAEPLEAFFHELEQVS